MVCPKCGKEGTEPGDDFCRHCGFSLATPSLVPESAVGVAGKKSVTVTNSDGGSGLLIFGAAILVMVPLFILAVAPWMGWLNFVASVLPFAAAAVTLVGLVLLFIGFGLRHAH